jgi:hypothetical protein
MAPNQRTALIYGSCVSRDLIRIDEHRFSPGYYLARQSWISACAERRPAPPLPIASAFQKRMVEGDFQSNGRQILGSTRPQNADLILLDLIDERLGVLPYRDSWITWSNELRKSNALPEAESDVLAFGTDQHFHLWRDAAESIRDILSVHFEKSFVLAARFASRTAEGDELPMFRGDSATEWNRRYQRYYSALADLGFTMIEMADELVISTDAHRWGATPFHYVDDAYLRMGDAILARLP